MARPLPGNAAERTAEDELLSLPNLHSGSARIGASTTIATYMIAEYLGTFHRTYPGIDLHLVSATHATSPIS